MRQKSESQIFKIVVTITVQLLVLLFSSVQVYADDKQELEEAKNNVAGDSDSDNGTQGNNNTNADYRSWGWHSEDMGYIMYFEDKDGSICQQVIQITWGDFESQLALQKVEASLGYRIPRASYTYEEVAEYLPGLEGPYYGGNPWGGQLDSWFENCDGSVSQQMSGATQHIPDVLAIFQLAGQDNVNTLAAKYDKDDIRLVVEAVYWYKPIDANGYFIFGDGYYQDSNAAKSAGTFMGTVKTIAWFNAGHSLGNSFGGFYYGTLTNHSWPMQMYTAYKDEYCGVGAPATIENMATDTGSYSNNTIMNMNYGFGMHIIRVDNAMEQWYTYKTPSGLSGGSPGAAPEMPNPLGLTDEARPITIIKYYEYRTIENGHPSYKKAAGPFTRKQVCRIISVQDELDAGWSLDSYFVSTDQGLPATWDKFKATQKKFPKNSSPKTITVPDRYDHLYVRLIQDKEPENPEPEDDGDAVEMVLYESEISKAYVSNKIKGNTMDDQNKPEIKINWIIPNDLSGYCWDDKHYETQTDKYGHIHGGWEGDSYDHKTGDFNDKQLQFNLKFKEDELKSYEKIIATKNDPFKYKLIKDGSEKLDISDVTSASEDDSKFKDFGLKYVIWRGEDQPTVQNYATGLSDGAGAGVKQTAADSTKISKLLETTASKEDQGKRKDSQDVEVKDRYYGGDNDTNHHLKMTFYVDPDNGDFTLQKTCDHAANTGHRGSEEHHESTTVNVNDLPKYNFDGNVTVFYYNDEETPVADQHKKPSASPAGDGTPAINQDYDTAEFYPYVQMSYQTTGEISDTGVNSDGGGVVYVLSSYKRYVNAAATMRIKWNRQNYSGTKYNMLVKSDQWSTHATAIEKYGKNIVLPGGAIFMLTTNGSGSGALGGYLEMEAWYPDTIPEYQSGMVHYDSKWTGTNGADEFNALVTGAVNALSNNEVVMRVQAGQSSDAQHGTIVKPGTQLSGLSAKGVKASSDTKYYLTGDASAANSKYNTAAGGLTIDEDIDIIAKPDGQVKITGGPNLNKNQGVNQISATSNAGRAEKSTGLIQSMLQALSRNKGNDKMTTFGSYWAREDGAWYNEQFGMKINYYKATITVVVPQNDGVGAGGVQAVLDPNLCAVHNGTSDKFDNVNTAQFYMVCKNTSTGAKFGNQTVMISITDLMKSQPFYIAAYTVQDND